MALQDRLVNLCFQRERVVSVRMQRSEEHSSTRQVALGLCDISLSRHDIDLVWGDIQNLIKLPQRFGETTKEFVGNRVLSEQVNVARVEPLSFVEVRLAPVPLASPPRDIGQRLRNPAAIWQELMCLLKVTHRGVIIF